MTIDCEGRDPHDQVLVHADEVALAAALPCLPSGMSPTAASSLLERADIASLVVSCRVEGSVRQHSRMIDTCARAIGTLAASTADPPYGMFLLVVAAQRVPATVMTRSKGLHDELQRLNLLRLPADYVELEDLTSDVRFAILVRIDPGDLARALTLLQRRSYPSCLVFSTHESLSETWLRRLYAEAAGPTPDPSCLDWVHVITREAQVGNIAATARGDFDAPAFSVQLFGPRGPIEAAHRSLISVVQ